MASGIPAKKIETEPLETHNSGDLLSAFRLAGMILRHGSTVVHVHSRKDFAAAVLAVSFARCVKMLTQGIPTAPGTRPPWVSGLPVLVLHAHLLKKLGIPKWLSGRFFESGAHAVFAVSEATRDFLLTVHRFHPNFVPVIYNGIDRGKYEMLPQKRRCCREEMRRKWNIPDTALVGPEGESGARRSLEAAADATGLPVIATDVGGCREVVEGGMTGLLIEGKNEISLREALLFLLDPGSPALRQRMGEAGQRRARQLFSVEQQVESLEVHYQNLINHDSYESLPKINHT